MPRSLFLLLPLLLVAPLANAASLDGAQVRAAFESAARRALPDTVVALEVHGVFVRGDVELSDDAVVELRLRARADEDWLGSVAVTAAIYADGQLLREVPVTAEVIGWVEVPVLRQPVGGGQILGIEDLSLARRDASSLPRGTVRSLEALLGRTARRELGLNQLVKEQDLRARVDGKRGQPVTLFIETTGLRIAAPGVLRQDARIGDPVAVLNTVTHKVVYGVLAAGGRVRVGVTP